MKKTHMLRLWISKEELKMIKEKAGEYGMSEYVRCAIRQALDEDMEYVAGHWEKKK